MTADAIIMMIVCLVGYVGAFIYCFSLVLKRNRSDGKSK